MQFLPKRNLGFFLYMRFLKCQTIISWHLQNKILHNRLEAMHIKLAESDRKSAGISSTNTNSDPLGDDGLQNVVNYLRRSKEIVSISLALLASSMLRMHFLIFKLNRQKQRYLC